MLVILGANPVFTAPADLKFAAAMAKVAAHACTSGCTATRRRMHSQWHVPETHYLETWSDARAGDGTVTVCQPLIEPLYECRSAHEVIAALAGETQDPARDRPRLLEGELGRARRRHLRHADRSDRRRLRQLREVLAARRCTTASCPAPRSRRRPVALAAGAVAAAPAEAPASGLEVTFHADPSVYDGRFANNGWLQELPKPFDKVCWDNVAYVSPRTAESLGMAARQPVVYGVEVYVANLTVNGHSLQVPLWVMPGQPDDSIALHLGYGRTSAGRIGNGLGYNANFFRYSATPWVLQGASLALTGQIYNVACTQGHFQMENRALIRVGTRAQYEHEPDVRAAHGARPRSRTSRCTRRGSTKATPGAWPST